MVDVLHHFYFICLGLHGTEVEFNENAVESLVDVDLTLSHQVECSVNSISFDLQVICPRCKTETSSKEQLAVCSNKSCGATFRSKVTSVRIDMAVTEIGE